MNIENFETYLRQGNMAENTIAAYRYAVKEYYSRHKELNRKIDMICQCDINTLIQLYIQILFRIGNDITRELHML